MNYSLKFNPQRLIAAWFLCVLMSSISMAKTSKHDTLTMPKSTTIITKDELNCLPFRDEYQKYFSLLPGVVDQTYKWDWWLHVRGGRQDQIGYSVDGINIRSSFTGEPLFHILPEALESIELNSSPDVSITSSPSVFIQEMLTGTNKFKISLSGESDNFTNMYEKKLDTYSYGFRNLTGTVSGPVIRDKIHFFAAGQYNHFDDHFRKFWDGFTFSPDPSVLNEPDYYGSGSTHAFKDIFGTTSIIVKPGNIPNANSDQYSFQGNVTGHFNPVFIRVTGLYSKQSKLLNRYPIKDIFNPFRIPIDKNRSSLISIHTMYKPNSHFSSSVNFGIFSNSQKRVDPFFGENFFKYADSSAIAQKTGIPLKYLEYANGYYKLPPEFYSALGFLFSVPGDNLTDLYKNQESGIFVNAEAKYKTGYHTIRASLGFDKRTVRLYSIDSYLDNYNLTTSLCNYIHSIGLKQSSDITGKDGIRINDYIVTFGYDGIGNPINQGTQAFNGPLHPARLNAYIEDTFKHDIVAITGGIRLDRFSTDAIVFPKPKTPPEQIYYYYQSPEKFSRAKSHSCVQPRLNVSLTPNDRMRMHIAWGKYAQLPRLTDVYTSSYKLMENIYSGFLPVSTIQGPNAKPVLSTQSEIGIMLNISKNISASVKTYYSISENLLEFGYQETNLYEDYLKYYPVLMSNGKSRTNGLEVNVNAYKGGLDIRTNYTFSKVKGTSTYPHSNWFEYDIIDKIQGIFLQPLEYNQAHRLNMLLSYKFSKKSFLLIKNLQASLLFQYNSGHSFSVWNGGDCGNYLGEGGLLTEDDPRCRGKKIADITTPDVYTFDVKIEKPFCIDNLRMSVYVYVHNLSNRKNAMHVYWRTGSSDSDGYLNLIGYMIKEYLPDEYIPFYEQVNLKNRQHYAIKHGGDLFGHPREIRAGLRFSIN